jgi:hypothetical protein
MEVCPGGCNEKPDCEDEFGFRDSASRAFLSDEDIATLLHDEARALCRGTHPQTAEILEIADMRVVWSKELPMPAYFSPSQMRIVGHSSAVTSGHLALIQVRGGKDKLGIAYQTYDQHDGQVHVQANPVNEPSHLMHQGSYPIRLKSSTQTSLVNEPADLMQERSYPIRLKSSTQTSPIKEPVGLMQERSYPIRLRRSTRRIGR